MAWNTGLTKAEVERLRALDKAPAFPSNEIYARLERLERTAVLFEERDEFLVPASESARAITRAIPRVDGAPRSAFRRRP